MNSQAPDEAIVDFVMPLIKACDDGIKGYEMASEAVEDQSLREVMLGYVAQRRDYRTRLTDYVFKPYDMEIKDQSHIVGVVHRAWIALQGQIQGDVHVLYACEQADFIALGIYDNAIESAFIPELCNIIQSQRDGIQRAWEHLRELEKLYSYDDQSKKDTDKP